MVAVACRDRLAKKDGARDAAAVAMEAAEIGSDPVCAVENA